MVSHQVCEGRWSACWNVVRPGLMWRKRGRRGCTTHPPHSFRYVTPPSILTCSNYCQFPLIVLHVFLAVLKICCTKLLFGLYGFAWPIQCHFEVHSMFIGYMCSGVVDSCHWYLMKYNMLHLIWCQVYSPHWDKRSPLWIGSSAYCLVIQVYSHSRKQLFRY